MNQRFPIRRDVTLPATVSLQRAWHPLMPTLFVRVLQSIYGRCKMNANHAEYGWLSGTMEQNSAKYRFEMHDSHVLISVQ